MSKALKSDDKLLKKIKDRTRIMADSLVEKRGISTVGQQLVEIKQEQEEISKKIDAIISDLKKHDSRKVTGTEIDASDVHRCVMKHL